MAKCSLNSGTFIIQFSRQLHWYLCWQQGKEAVWKWKEGSKYKKKADNKQLSAAGLKGPKALNCPGLHRDLAQANSRGTFQLSALWSCKKDACRQIVSAFKKWWSSAAVLKGYRILSFWHWCFQAPLSSYHVQKPFILSRMLSLHCIAIACHTYEPSWVFRGIHSVFLGHPAPISAQTKHAGSSCHFPFKT